tara:strand:- start:11736 stop:12143 length:408 start_codon:yes stop_codon:yes gene_type:complete
MVKRVLPNLKNFASVRQIKRRIKGSEVIYQNRETLAQELINLGTANITDIVSWSTDEEGKTITEVRDIKDIPKSALGAIKRIRILQDGTLDIEMIDKVRVLQMLAKSAGLLDAEQDADKPAVIDIKMVGPSEDKS